MAAVTEGAFRMDLFYRLNVFPIRVPPLRQRKSDIRPLLKHFVDRHARQVGKAIRFVDPKTFEILRAYDWPGNVRELQNVVERSVILSSGETLPVDPLWLLHETFPETRPSRPLSGDDEKTQERKIIEATLVECRGRIAGPTGAAARLKVPRSTLESRIRTLNIQKRPFEFPAVGL